MVVGAALFYAWDLYGIYCGSVVSAASVDVIPHCSVIVHGVAALLGFVPIACGLYRLRAFYAVGLAMSVVAGLSTPAALAATHALGADPAVARLAAEALGRVGACWVIVSWGAQFARLDAHAITVNILCSFALALLACLALVFSPRAVRAAFVSLALPSSMGVLVALRRRGLPERSAERTRLCSETFLGLTWRVIVVFFLFGVVTWMTIMSNRTEEGASASSAVVILAGSMAVVIALLAVALRKGGALTKSYTYKVVLPLIMSGVLLMGVASVSTALCWPLVSIGYTCFDLFCFALYANACRRTGTNALRAFGWCRAAECLAPMAALGIMEAFRRIWGAPESLFLDLVVPAAIFAILAMIALDQSDVFESAHIDPDVAYPRPEVLFFARQCQEVIERYALSPRESEVLSLIVRGRSVPHISQRLAISASTTKTHIAHIYEKLGVCDRQEMIDLIESTELDGGARAEAARG